MIDINTLFSSDKKDAVAFYAEEHDLTPDERMKLHTFFEGMYKTTTIAKSFMGISAGLTMVWLARRKRKISPLLAMLGGVGLSAFVFSFMTPAIYQNKLDDLKSKHGMNSKLYKVIEVTPQPAEYSYYWSQYFEASITDKSARLKNPSEDEEFVDSEVPFGHRSTKDKLIEEPDVGSKNTVWEEIRESASKK